MKTKLLRILPLLPAAAALSLIPAAQASEATARAEAAVSEVKGDVAKSALADLDAEMDRLEVMVDSAPTMEEKNAARARLDALKERRSELRKTYVKARYEELKADVRAEANRLGAWTKRTFSRADDKVRNAAADVRDDTRDAAADAKRRLNHAGDHTSAAAASTAASMDLAAYKLRPTDTNKDEAKAALKALDAQIEALEDRVDAMPSGATRDAAERRVKALEDRKDELQGNFNKERFNALVDEVQAEWKNLR